MRRPDVPPVDRSLGWYLHFVRRRMVPLAAGLALGLAVGAGLVAATPVTYTATAQLTLSVLASSVDSSSRQQVSIDSDAQLLTSTRVLQTAAETVGYPGGAATLHERVRVRARPSSRVLELTVRDTDPERARATAAAVADHFLVLRRETAEEQLVDARSRVDRQVDEVSSRIAVVRAAVSDADAQDLGPVERSLLAELEQLQQEFARLVAAEPEAGFVSAPPALPDHGERPRTGTTLVSCAMLGLLGGACAGWLADGFRRDYAGNSA